ncbi:Bacteriophage lambda head decoration protein D [Pseudomonas citronellolis]|uniref:Bacteriophage lambda head decoration protein D n=1 Tax=Pseudomonas citronellolis TaxID=53408 RepID=A0AAQ1HU82_9PSED|nr:head decoration protein [Pseudomonas citronellolis]TGC30827.1 head decoration protein [Pseudomonas citronellolis]SFC84570.1 Bacteriophage lambda head decoration protein D [Pseudomonas citronellolis]
MPVLYETRRAGDFVLSEANGNLSRESIVIDSGVHLPGTVLGKVTATGKFVALAPAATDGSQTAAAVLRARADATDGDVNAVGYVRLAEVRADLLVWPAGIADEDKTEALQALAGAFLVAR